MLLLFFKHVVPPNLNNQTTNMAYQENELDYNETGKSINTCNFTNVSFFSWFISDFSNKFNEHMVVSKKI